MLDMLFQPVNWIPLSLLLGSGAFFAYAKIRPEWANRWSRMQPRCDRCHELHDWRESGLCESCERDDVAEIQGYE